MNIKKHKLLAALCTAGIGSATVPVQAANWLMLQGTEPGAAASPAKLWGFVQVQYQQDSSDAAPDGTYIPPKLLGPDLDTQSGFNVNRARIGVRGIALPLDPKVNYFVLLEMGNNAITAPGNQFAKVTDASITLNHIPGARIRAGLFKTPGPEEGLQAIHVFDYINFTTMGNQLMLERFPNRNYTANTPSQRLSAGQSLNGFEESVGAYRDVGIQVFDSFKHNDWDFSYALMVGNGNGLDISDSDGNKDTYMYLSAEQVYGGKGPWQEGLKFFGWHHNGKRTLDNTDDDAHNPREFDRKRSGVGVKFFKKPWRATAEYMRGKGMIFVGPHAPTFDQNGSGPAADGSEGKASGWYVEGGWYIPNTKWEIDLRYDVYNRLEDDPGPPRGPAAGRSFESEWKTWTLGFQYHFNKKTRATFNYAIRDVESPEWPEGAGPNANMDGIDNRIGVQLTAIF